MQQAPVGQVLPAAHVDPAPRNVPPAPTQSDWENTEQNPFPKQHAPVGCGQVTLPQAVASPWYVPLRFEQSVAVWVSHTPDGRQHAPTPGWHETDCHVVR